MVSGKQRPVTGRNPDLTGGRARAGRAVNWYIFWAGPGSGADSASSPREVHG